MQIDENLVEFVLKKGRKFLFKSKNFVYENTPGGPDRYFYDLSKLSYRRESGKYGFPLRSWKIAFKYLIVSKKVFELAAFRPVRVLDLGCGKGFLRRVLEANIRNNEVVEYYGIDVKENLLKSAIFDETLYTGAEGDKIETFYILHDLNIVPIPIVSESIDIAVSFQVTKYNDKSNVKKMFNEVYRVLKKDGVFYLSTDPIYDETNSIPPEDFMKKVRYKSFWYTQELVKCLKGVGFKNMKIFGAENTLNSFIKNVGECELKIIERMKELFPEEIIESLFGFFHPETTNTKLIIANK